MTQRSVDIVTDFYAAHAEAIPIAIDVHFAADAAIEWLPSLAHGGHVRGSRRLRGRFTGIAKVRHRPIGALQMSRQTTCSAAGLGALRGRTQANRRVGGTPRPRSTKAPLSAVLSASTSEIGAKFDAAMAGIMGGDLAEESGEAAL
jgi:hypothetical protein